ncbi:hypothetical protein G9A89_018817 [Geosiphon pyriformis]|nr:hypothetical protein G9A89_018817 [Geosiphon pyriformis]
MDLKTALGGDMSKKKASKDDFHGSAGGFFVQKKRMVLGNVKHFGDKRDISLSKSEPGDSVYFDVDSLFGDDKDVGMTGVYGGSLLDLAATTSKAKCVNTGIMFGSSLGSPDFTIDDDEIVFPLHVSISLEKKWIDPKVVKTQVEVSVKKSFALDINLSAVEGKSAMAKTQVIRKLFSKINGFGRATTPSKFEGIIRSTFTSSESMEKAMSLVKENNIIVNSDLKKQRIHSDWAMVIKEILMDMPKDMIVTANATNWVMTENCDGSFLIWKDSVHVAKAIGDHDIWAFRNCFRALLFTLPAGTTVHDLSNLLDNTGGKTCIINCSLDTGNRVCCAVVGFKSKNDLNFAFLTEPVFGGVYLSWARLDLCNVSDMSPSNLLSSFNKKHAPNMDCFQLAKLYAKKNVPISRSAAFVSFASSSGGSLSGSDLSVGLSPLVTSGLGGNFPSSIINDSFLNACLASLECSFKLLAEQVSSIVKKLSFIELVPMVSSAGASLLVGSVPLVSVLDFDMALDGKLALSTPYFPSADLGAGFSSSSSKVLTTKMGSLESKMSALEAFVISVLVRLDLLCSGLGFLLSFSAQ